MELLSPSYLFLSELVMSLDSGHSARHIIESYINHSQSLWSKKLTKAFYMHATDSLNKAFLKTIDNSYERAMLSLILKSLDGLPILNELKSLEMQYFQAHAHQLEAHILKLPYLTLLPLFLFLFPSYLILMLGPILKNLITELSF